VRALAVGPTGDLFVFHVHSALHPADGTTQCSVFSREGNYVKTVIPYPANTPEEKLSGLKRIELEDGSRIPYIYQVECRELVPGLGEIPATGPVVTSDGRLAIPAVQDFPSRYNQAGPVRLLTLGVDGSAPSGVLGAKLADSSLKAGFLALSPDEKTLYVTDLSKEGKKPVPQDHVVYKFGWSDKEPQVFAGIAGEVGSDEKHLNSPSDVAVDRAGLVYVADRKNDRVAVFKPDGSWVGALKVDKPCRIKIHPKTGALYVLGGVGINILEKYTSYKDEKPAASTKIGTFKHEEYTAVIALDGSGDTPVIWAGAPKGYYSGFSLLRIEDKGAEFSKPVDVGKAQNPAGIGPVTSVEYNRVNGVLEVNSRAYDAEKNSWKPAPNIITSYALSVGLDGNYYTQIYGNYLLRFGPDFKSIPFPNASNKNGGTQDPGTSARLRGRGVTADAQGNIYMIWQEDYAPKPPMNHVHVHTPDGAVKKEKLIESDIRSLNSVRLDYQGNVYLALGLRPGNERVPKGLQGKVPDGPKDPDALGNLNGYPLMYGSIAKFGPDGGVVKKGSGGVPCNYAFANETDVKGAKWIYSGASPVPSWRTAGTPDICLCESPRFDVDGYGRSFFPDAGRFRVGVLDTNGNEICFFGSYGNPDSGGAGSKIPQPAIPLQWPYAIAVGDDVVFVGDRLNRRVVKLKLEYAAEKVVPIKP
jgi:hypothetical protein